MNNEPSTNAVSTSQAVGQTSFTLSRNDSGRLVWTGANGQTCVGVVPVRAFPISAADEGLSLVDADGHELAWMDRIDQLPPNEQELVRQGLQEREFMPEIKRLKGVSGFATPSTWSVETDRGDFELVLKGEEDIRRLTAGTLLVADCHGVQFLIRDLFALDRQSKKLLDRFL